MHLLPSALLALASLQVVWAVRLPFSPESSLQNRQKAREVYERRQARKRDIVRRLKDGPRRRQTQTSAGMCIDSQFVGSNKVVNGDFGAGPSGTPWVLDKTASSEAAFYGNAGYGPSGGNRGFGARGVSSSATITQPVCVTLGATYTLSFNSGVFGYNNDGDICVLEASVEDVLLSTSQPCSASSPCDLRGGNNQPFRFDSISYASTQSGTVEIKFQVRCGENQGRSTYTVLDNVGLTRAA